MLPISILSGLLMLWLAERVSADGGDDFANNLASDLGPIIALFGERVVMQFMSQAMGIADCILLAVLPIGAITTVVSAIRVAGPTSLKSLIGRARENLSAAEVEVMSSTSEEVCELWNGHSVVRCPGSANIYQFICLLPKDFDPKSVSKTGITVRCEELSELKDEDGNDILEKKGQSKTRYFNSHMLNHILSRLNVRYQRLLSFHVSFSQKLDLEAGTIPDGSGFSTQMEVDRSGRTNVTHRTRCPPPIPGSKSEKTGSSESKPSGVKDPKSGEEKEIIVIMDTSDKSSPNLLLNCHDRVSRREIYIYAALGVIIQFDVLIYFGISSYYLPINHRFFLKVGKRIVGYAFPCAAAGTILLVLGLFICARVVEKSTTETYYKAPNHQMFVVWLQKDHTVSDQVFKPYAIYPAGERQYITMSRRNIGRTGQDEESGEHVAKDQQNKGAGNSLWDRRSKPMTFFGALIALIGFISQFIGMRGLNWTASVVQLIATLLVTAFRAIVRRGLSKSPIPIPLLSNTELDWFSLTFGDLASAPWALSKDELPSVREHVVSQDEKSPKWTVRTGGNQPYRPLREPSSDIDEARKESAAHKMMVTRQMLCKLSKWKSSVREEAVLLSRAIELAAETFLSKLPDGKLVWTIAANFREIDEDIFIGLEKKEGKWRVEEQNLEAALSLWLYSTSSARESNGEQPLNLRLYGPVQSRGRLSRDLVWWMPEEDGSEENGSEEDGSEGNRSEGKLRYVVVGFTSEVQDSTGKSLEMDTVHKPNEEYLVVECVDTRERLYCRDLLFSFLRAVAKMPEVTIESARSKSQMRYKDMTDGWEQLKLENTTISGLARKLEKIGFGALSDIYFDLTMPLSLERKLTNIKDVIDEANEQAQKYEQSHQWKNLVDTCCCLLDLAKQFDMEKEPSGPKAVAVCLEYFCRLRHEAELQRDEVRGEKELTMQLEVLKERLESINKDLGEFALFPRVKHFLAESGRGYATTFDMLIGATPDATTMFPESFNIVDKHRQLMRASGSGKTLYWWAEELGNVDIFGWSPLHYAANWQMGDVRFVIWDVGDVLSLRDLMGRTPLHHACLKGNKKAVDLLLAGSVPIEVAGNDGITPIHCAVLSGNSNILERLIEEVNSDRLKHSRESTSHVDRNRRLPIHWAAAQGRTDMVQLLKDDIDLKDRFGWACIHLAVIYKHKTLLEYLTKDLSADVNLRDNNSRTPLHLAMDIRSWEAFNVLIQAGAKLNVKDRDGLTPLHKARTALHLAIGSKRITEKLLKHGADTCINAKDMEGRTPLYLASIGGTAEVVALLIDKDADVAIAAEDGRTPLHMALSRGKDGLEVAKRLLNFVPGVEEPNPYVNAKAKDDATPLHSEVVRILLERGADTKPLNNLDFTALQYAVYLEDLDVVKEFVKHDMISAPTAPKAVMDRGENGDIPLHTLCRYSWTESAESGMCEMLEALLSVATDIDMINTLNAEGLTPLDLARFKMDESSTFIGKLKEKGAKPSDKEPSENR
ncbi:hypothetical protein HDV57DRAFT_525688 [Trichoderma longibrachiatum]